MRWLAASLIVLAAGCGGKAPLTNTSLAQSRLAEAETRAAALVKSGDFSGAARHYGEALRIATTLENADAIAANAINLSSCSSGSARTPRRAPRSPRCSTTRAPRSPSGASSRPNYVARSSSSPVANIGAAAIWAGQADRRCAATNCEYAATILNVRAQVELDSAMRRRPRASRRRPPTARAAAPIRAENANALRTLGRARQAQAEPAAALASLRQALEIDREIGDPRKILADLAELARAADAAATRRPRKDYKERGLAVSRAMNAGGAGEASLIR